MWIVIVWLAMTGTWVKSLRPWKVVLLLLLLLLLLPPPRAGQVVALAAGPPAAPGRAPVQGPPLELAL